MTPALLVAPCAHNAMVYAVKNWHYSRSIPMPPRATYGVWEFGSFIGAIVYSPGANRDMATEFDLPLRGVCELTRVALRAHTAPVSQIVARSLKLLRNDSPGIELIYSYADPSHDHHGGIYQAMNWVYLGQNREREGYRDPRTGRNIHPRNVTMSRDVPVSTPSGKAKGKYRGDLLTYRQVGKHRYVMPLTKRMRRITSKRSQPYPARVGGIDGDTPSIPKERQVRPLPDAQHGLT